MEKTAVITKVGDARKWQSPDGTKTAYYRFIELDNGDKGEIGAQSESPEWLQVGIPLIYTIEGKEYNGSMQYKIKKVQAQNGGGRGFGGNKGGDPKQMLATMTAAYAKDILVAHIAKDPMADIQSSINDFARIYDAVYEKVSSKL